MSGHERLSGLISDAAIPPLFERNVAEEPTYTCKHIAIEPYENPWLERLGIEIIRRPVQNVDLDLFRSLRTNDILFIDLSHVILIFYSTNLQVIERAA